MSESSMDLRSIIGKTHRKDGRRERVRF
jgi:hypothetical protein